MLIIDGVIKSFNPIFKYTSNHDSRDGAIIDTIIVHYTADFYINQTINWVINPRSKISYHILIPRLETNDVYIYQFVNLLSNAWHAGRSIQILGDRSTRADERVNQSSIGIALQNAGLLKKKNGKFYSWSGIEIPKDQVKRAENQYWHTYTDYQITVLQVILDGLYSHKDFNLKYCLGHEEIAPLRKVDPGPLCLSDVHNFWKKLKTHYGNLERGV